MDKKRIKVFISYIGSHKVATADRVTNEVNNWLDENPHLEFIDIKISDSNDYFVSTIIYCDYSYGEQIEEIPSSYSSALDKPAVIFSEDQVDNINNIIDLRDTSFDDSNL